MKKELLKKALSLLRQSVMESVIITLLALIVMTFFEEAKNFFYEDITIEESHVITIIFVSLMVGISVYFVICRTRRKMQESEQKFKTIFDNVSDGMFLLDLRTKKFFLVNKSCLKITGYSQEEFSKLSIADLHPKEELQFIYQQLEKYKNGTSGIRRDTRFKRKDGSIFFADISLNKITLDKENYVLGAFKDVTKRKSYEDEIRYLAYRDQLTGLPNRRLFFDRLNQILIRAKRKKGKMAVMMIDLDYLKKINDDLGHESGDLLIKETGSRIAEILRAEDTVARLGGDEFAVIISEISQQQNVKNIAKKIIENVGRSLKISENVTTNPVISIGIAIFPSHGLDGDMLVKNADVAMYVVKRRRTGDYQIYFENQSG